MSAPVVDADALELPEFEHTPTCEHFTHRDAPTPPPATHYVHAHRDEACFSGFRCAEHIDWARQEFASWLRERGYVQCAYCHQRFHAIAEYVTVTPLRSPSP